MKSLMFLNRIDGFPEATEQRALQAAARLMHDLHVLHTVAVVLRAPERDFDGYFGFRLLLENKQEMLVQIPGLDLNRLLFYGTLEQNPFYFDRLYLNGDSWLWKYVLQIVEEHSETDYAK